MATIAVNTSPPRPPVPGAAEGPRKRRKRAPAAGAADDCFTCANHSAKCDRRRPYCTPCLESGQDCAGYKTQLTWGIGVASRGKLRGLSLPVAGTKKITDPEPVSKKKRMPLINTSKALDTVDTPALPLSPESGTDAYTSRPSAIRANSHAADLRDLQSHHVTNISVPTGHHTELLPSPASTHMDTSSVRFGWSNPTIPFTTEAYCVPPTSPVSYDPARQYSQTFGHQHETYGENYHMVGLTPNLNTTEPLQSLWHEPVSYFNDADGHSHLEELDQSAGTIRVAPTESGGVSKYEDDIEDVLREDNALSDTLSISSAPLLFDTNINWTPFSGIHSVGNTPRMQYLIQYYAEVISPVIVAFDSPSNPFRHWILHLAAKSDGLQHALSALAASNLRQRQESGTLSSGRTPPARRSSQAHLSLTTDTIYNPDMIAPVHDQKREEVFHRYHAVQHVNMALASPQLRKDDSVLATLLILCLFHICDSGVARFQTQFAGVKKLLQLRRAESGEDEPSTRWMTRLFTLYDATAATVNDREGQFDNQSLDSSALSDEEWSFESLAGVDGRLFRVMSQLGRLNILSQGKPVESSPTIVSRPLPYMNFLHTNMPPNVNTFDGNGWMRIVEDENFFMSKSVYNAQFVDDQFQRKFHPSVGPVGEIEEQSFKSEQFWREWREVRQQLQLWNADLFPGGMQTNSHHSHLTDEQLIDVQNISNAFRYSALLYTERLGCPTLPSNHEKIQYWVRRSLQHIKDVRSDVYLLWPLFITGSECVSEEERNIIRERCQDIQKDSGFINNASCLALLEKVWERIPIASSNGLNGIHNVSHCADKPTNGFRFRDVMLAEGTEGEWIVV